MYVNKPQMKERVVGIAVHAINQSSVRRSLSASFETSVAFGIAQGHKSYFPLPEPSPSVQRGEQQHWRTIRE